MTNTSRTQWWARFKGEEGPFSQVYSASANTFQQKELWALQDLNFEGRQGKVLGIIGKNAAGKFHF